MRIDVCDYDINKQYSDRRKLITVEWGLQLGTAEAGNGHRDVPSMLLDMELWLRIEILKLFLGK